ncbi:MAG: PAS domain-containing protein [Bacteroidetes bacterium]|jgi:PAS domain S-box-containing protein|nr:PAS domain-containing protein [Bacteroidota bacterium]
MAASHETRSPDASDDARDFAERIVATVRQPLVVLDGDLHVRSVNAAFEDTFEVSQDDVLGQYIFTLGNGQWDIPELRRLLGEVLPRDTQVVDYEVEHFFPDIGRRIMWLNAHQMAQPANGSAFILLAIEDVTERRRAQRQLERYAADLKRTNEELDNFAYVASHDLRAPLRNIDNLAQWLTEDLGDDLPDDSQRHLRLLRQRVQRMERLLDDLLKYSRAGRYSYDIDTVDSQALVHDIVHMLDVPPAFTIDVAPDMPTLRAARVPLEQVLMNLISNAVKHHDRPDGRVTVQARTDGEHVVFEVADDGPGIAPQYQERIFGMFQTLRRRDEVEASGIGLALVKKLVEHVGGSVSVASEEGQGTTFRFTWPLDEAAYRAQQQAGVAVSP